MLMAGLLRILSKAEKNCELNFNYKLFEYIKIVLQHFISFAQCHSLIMKY